MNETAFLKDLAILMAVGGFVTFLFARLRWPKVLGYIFSGILMSGYTWGGGFLADEGSIRTIAQLGIVFLMFTMGLGFSPSEMKKIRSTIVPTALVDTMVMTAIGYTVGRVFLDWGMVASLFLGIAICDSSTTMLAKVIGEMRLGGRPFVKLVLGTSVIEDIICVGLIALATGIGTGGGVDFSEIGASLGGLGVFFLATLVFGFIFFTRWLRSVMRHYDDEVLMMVVLGCLFFVTFVAFKLNFSPALGAFLVGIICGSSVARERLEKLVEPLRSMFAAMFFITIGLLVDPSACWRHLPAILIVSAAVMGGKLFNCTVTALASGEKPRTAIEMGFSLAQIGEFAFMVALMYVGMTGDVTSPMYPIVIGASLLTTVLNVPMMRAAAPFADWTERHLPRKVVAALETYRTTLTHLRAKSRTGGHLAEIRTEVVILVVIAMLEIAAAFTFGVLNGRDWSNFSELFNAHKGFVFSLALNMLLAGAFVAVVAVGRRLADAVAKTLVGAGEALWQQAVAHVTRLVVGLGVLTLFIAEGLMLNVNLAPEYAWEQTLVTVIIVLALLFCWRRFLAAARSARTHLAEALDDEKNRGGSELRSFTVPAEEIHELVVPAGSPAAGVTIAALNIRAKTGATVVAIERDGAQTRNIGPDWTFAAGDRLQVMGTAAQMSALGILLGAGK